MEIYIVQIEFGTPEFAEAVALRDEVLRRPLGLFFTPEQLSEEYANYHLAAYGQHMNLLGYLQLKPVDAKQVQMRQVAVMPAFQKKGIGQQLVQVSEEFAQKLGFQEIMLHARDTAVPFYEKLGYSVFGEPFEEVTIPHLEMRKSIQ